MIEIDDPLINSGIVHFTGWKRSSNFTYSVCQLLYRGIVIFPSGRQEEIYYYESVKGDQQYAIEIGLINIHHTMDLASRGFLRGWFYKREQRWIGSRKKYRKINSVQWLPWNS